MAPGTVSPAPESNDQVFVALDLETTGLDSNRDAIIEVGAVKFQGSQVLDTFQTLVNPGFAIPEFIQHLTGISSQQVRRAPYFNAIADNLRTFLEAHPIVGHNISFDLRFLDAHGLRLANPSYDTWDLASMLLPRTPEYSLGYLSSFLNISHTDPHRALADAQATHGVFVALLQKAAELDPGLLSYIVGIASRSQWPVANLLTQAASKAVNGRAGAGLTGLDFNDLVSRLARPEKRRVESPVSSLDYNDIAALLSDGGPFARAFPGFERRPEQDQMLAAVTGAIFEGRHLVVEGGTGVGKSLAYLLPAAIFAATTGQRVVISTNTINLQEQLLKKDIPAITTVLEEAGLAEKGQLKSALLKGRGNYLCLRRWQYLARSESPSVDDARILGKTAVWLQDTRSGDRGEINLSGRDAFTWSRISAGDKGWCPGLRDGSPCFLRAARERAEQADILVVNHALLLSDLARGGSLIPEYQHLIVDEAHNLEDEATKQLGFQVASDRLEEELELQGRLVTAIRQALRGQGMAQPVRQQGETLVGDLEASSGRWRESWTRLWDAAEKFLGSQRGGAQDDQLQVLLTHQARGQRAWSEVALAWENLDVNLSQATQKLAQLHRFLESTSLTGEGNGDTLTMETITIHDNLEGLRGQLSAILGQPDEQRILWISKDPGRGEVTFHAAPLEVGPILSEGLFAPKECVVLTSATLSTQGNFDYFRQRSGMPEEAAELLVGSPFDYQRAALLLIPEDMPQPSEAGYAEALSRVIADLGKSLEGRTMALFTSYASLRNVSQRIRGPLAAQGVQVLAQGVDGAPQQLIRRFTENPKSVLLGTNSFWEGVDLPSGVLKALVLARLPFQVPTDPIVKARSGQYADAFSEYSVPQAVLRFRQGVGRLIRNKGDKGTIVVLDRRITGRSYGQAFLQSIPPCTLKPSSLALAGRQALDWIKDSRGTGH